ncbi:MAG: DNA methylase [Bacilli bacterium]|nr:DNA methylase [Bacilli bacterium]
MNKVFICIDLKSFYASVECCERGLDPLHTNLVVADSTRTEKTICLAVSPSLKKYGIPGRARLYEVVQKVKEVNLERKNKNHGKPFQGKSYLDEELNQDFSLELDYIVASPRMKYYMDYSTKIYDIYLRFVAPEDIFAYSIDEVFCDITNYLKTYKMTPKELITKMIQTVYEEMGITATGGIGTNMYLAKIAMDIVAKHADANEFGVRIAELDEISYRKLLWDHRPITDFWRVGKGISTQLAKHSIYTMGDVARASLEREDLLYKLFGVNAEFLIDHAWGLESCTMQDVKKYRPKVKSLSSGQVLPVPYDYEHTKLIVKEMTDHLVLDLVSKSFVTDQLVLDIGYDVENLNFYQGETTLDYYGRRIPKHAHGTIRLDTYTSSTKIISKKMIQLFEQIINQDLLVRRIVVVAGNLASKKEIEEKPKIEQLDLFSSVEENVKNASKLEEENQLQKTILSIKYKFGKNSILKGMNLEEGGTAIERGKQIGGHRE